MGTGANHLRTELRKGINRLSGQLSRQKQVLIDIDDSGKSELRFVEHNAGLRSKGQELDQAVERNQNKLNLVEIESKAMKNAGETLDALERVAPGLEQRVGSPRRLVRAKMDGTDRQHVMDRVELLAARLDGILDALD